MQQASSRNLAAQNTSPIAARCAEILTFLRTLLPTGCCGEKSSLLRIVRNKRKFLRSKVQVALGEKLMKVLLLACCTRARIRHSVKVEGSVAGGPEG